MYTFCPFLTPDIEELLRLPDKFSVFHHLSMTSLISFMNIFCQYRVLGWQFLQHLKNVLLPSECPMF